MLVTSLGLSTPSGAAQAGGFSEAASMSLEASLVGVPMAGLQTLSAGAELSVAALRPLGDSVELMLRASADGVTYSLRISAELAARIGIGIGTALVATVVAGGWLLSAAGEALLFVPSAAAAALIHHEVL